MADLEAVLADVSYLMAMEKSKATPAARASKKILLPEPSRTPRVPRAPRLRSQTRGPAIDPATRTPEAARSGVALAPADPDPKPQTLAPEPGAPRLLSSSAPSVPGPARVPQAALLPPYRVPSAPGPAGCCQPLAPAFSHRGPVYPFILLRAALGPCGVPSPPPATIYLA
ncbi:hypothetical protein P7K49_021411 [Saguinus oedipus]|uniref:Uncharacterized protein n=1 Tax=Saguinus oedipus TaxID=9490 RepID=A0ABQ9USL1_SAGOE|nr:hypothetical protein P7K49_021411 [Saguinus oedipus]